MSVIVKTVKNNKGQEDVWAGVTLQDQETYTIPVTQYSEWSISPKVISDIQSGDLIVNNGVEDLDEVLGEAHIKSGIVFAHEDIALLPGVGENAPEVMPVNGSAIGYHMNIDDKIFGQTKISGLIGDFVELQVHYTIDNSDSNKYIQFEVSYFTTNGYSDSKTINVADGSLDMGPELVEDTPWLVREAVVEIPSSVFENGETYLFVSVTRVTPDSGDSPTNNPIILRYCKRYYRVDN